MVDDPHPPDAALARRARRGDLEAFEALYRRYFQRVHDYVARATRNPSDAADVTQDTFILAADRIRQLRDPAKFRSWLFAIARRQVLNRGRSAGRELSEPAQEGERGPGALLSAVDTDRFSDPVEAASAAELGELVWEAASALDERTYSVLDLHIRQGLDSAEIAEVMGVSKNNAYVMVNRMKERVGGAIGSYLLVRKGTKDCDDLRGLVADAELPPVTAELKRSVDRHAAACDACESTRRRLVAPMNVLAALAAVGADRATEDGIWEYVRDAYRPASQSRARSLRIAGGGLLLAFLVVVLGAVRLGDEPAPTSDVVAAEPPSAGADDDAVEPTAAPPAPGLGVATTTSTTSLPPATTAVSTTTDAAPPTTTGPPPTTTQAPPPPPTTQPPPPTTQPDEVVPELLRPTAQPEEIGENTRACAAVFGTESTLSVIATDDVGIVSVAARWQVPGVAETTVAMQPAGNDAYVTTFGPVAAGTLPPGTPAPVAITMTAADAAGNETAATVTIVVQPSSNC